MHYMLPLYIIIICDPVCKKGSYSLSELLCLIHHNSLCFQRITFIFHPAIVPCKDDKWTKYQGNNIFTSKVTGCQVNAIKMAIRLVLADRVTYSACPFRAKLCTTVVFLQAFILCRSVCVTIHLTFLKCLWPLFLKLRAPSGLGP